MASTLYYDWGLWMCLPYFGFWFLELLLLCPVAHRRSFFDYWNGLFNWILFLRVYVKLNFWLFLFDTDGWLCGFFFLQYHPYLVLSGSPKAGSWAYLVTWASLIRMHLVSIFLSSNFFPGCSILSLCMVSLVVFESTVRYCPHPNNLFQINLTWSGTGVYSDGLGACCHSSAST